MGLLKMFVVLLSTCLFAANPIDNLQPGEWYEVPNSHLASTPPGGNVINPWSGGAFDTKRNQLIVWGGGHGDYSGNEVYAFSLDSLKWSVIKNRSTAYPFEAGCNYEVNADSQPLSRHTYNGLTYMSNVDMVFSHGGYTWPCAYGDTVTWLFDYTVNKWVRGGSTSAGYPLAVAYDPIDGSVWAPQSGKIGDYNPILRKWTMHTLSGTGSIGMIRAIDPVNRLLVGLDIGTITVSNIAGLAGTSSSVTYTVYNTTGDVASLNAGLNHVMGTTPGFVWDSQQKCFVGWNGGANVYTLNMAEKKWTKIVPASTNTVVPTQANANGTYGRFQYSPKSGVFVVVNSRDENVFIYRMGFPDTIAPATPSNLSATSLTYSEIRLNWSRVTDAGSGIYFYEVYRDGIKTAQTSDTFYINKNLQEMHRYDYYVVAVDGSGNKSAASVSASATTLKDPISPLLLSVNPIDSMSIVVCFNKAMDSASSINLSNYTLQSSTLLTIKQGFTPYQVIITTSKMLSGTSYILTVSNVSDKGSGVIPLGSQITFKYNGFEKGLLAYYPADELTGDSLFDIVTQKAQLSIDGSFARNDGLSGLSLQLDSTGNGYAHSNGALSSSSLSFPFSISMWVKVNAIGQSQSLLATEDVPDQYFGTWLDMNALGQPSINIGNGGSPDPNSRKSFLCNGALTVGKWNLVTAVVKSASDMAIYINGVNNGGTYSGTAVHMAHSSSGKFSLGRRASSGNILLKYQGAMDEIRIYQRELTSSDVSLLLSDSLIHVSEEFVKSEDESISLSCFPKPFNPSMTIRLNGKVNLQNLKLRIFNATGKVVMQKQTTVSELKSGIVWQPEKISTGLYVIQLLENEKLVLSSKTLFLK